MKYIETDKLIAEIERRKKELFKIGGDTFENKWACGSLDSIKAFAISLQQEQPEVDLEKEIEKGWEELEKDYSPSALDKSYMIVSGLVGEKQFSRIARHFYELGLNLRKS